MVSRPQVLVACSDPDRQRTLLSVLSQCGLEPVTSSTVGEARAILARQPIALVFCAAELPDGTFRDLLRAPEAAAAKVPVVVASRVHNTGEYLEAMRLGAFDFIACPYQRAEVERIVTQALPQAMAATV